MGWTGYPGKTPEQALEAHIGDAQVLERTPLAGGHVWLLCEAWDTHQPMIVAIYCDGNSFKDVDESMGPKAFDCPLEWLERAPVAPGPFAQQWRERVREEAVGAMRTVEPITEARGR